MSCLSWCCQVFAGAPGLREADSQCWIRHLTASRKHVTSLFLCSQSPGRPGEQQVFFVINTRKVFHLLKLCSNVKPAVKQPKGKHSVSVLTNCSFIARPRGSGAWQCLFWGVTPTC